MLLNIVDKVIKATSARGILVPNTPSCHFTTSFCLGKNTEHTSAEDDKIQMERKRKLIEIELYWMHSLGKQCPAVEKITSTQWDHLFTLETQSSRQNYYRFLNQMAALKTKNEQDLQLRREYGVEKKQKIITERKEAKHLVYGLGHNSLFIRFRPKTITAWQNAKLRRARLFGQKLVIDCSFGYAMQNLQDRKMLAKQLEKCFAANRMHKKPLDLHLCGVDFNSITFKALHRQIPKLLDKSFLLGLHNECVTTLFPPEQIVVLSPDSENDLDYNFDDIYVVGGIIDRIQALPLTLAKANELGLRTARFPLDKYIRWAPGAKKGLEVHESVNILRDFSATRDWGKTLRQHVPKIKQAEFYEKFQKKKKHECDEANN